ncbi:ACT domain-containing protein [Glaciecola petra]|uniref:ACT domain-containing protein n=1 Tax=Glaciecola petra TaxID=3075602 RepID=A0ABU2ZNF0_9ALTE|nr:ACT domain-containing protein [Aestuariibacter sp. P117]MDT0594149.1 ACT domain-containing protein [Aestuariibacter sp. P117]
MSKQTLRVLSKTFAIHSLDENSNIPSSVFKCDIYFIGKTEDELSLVVPQSLSIPAIETDFDWRVLEVLGPLNLSLVGIMSDISGVLAAAKVSVFIVSTFETDFVLVKQEQLTNAINALKKARYTIIED